MNSRMNKEQLTQEQLDKLPVKFRFFNKKDAKEETVDVNKESDTKDIRYLRFTKSDVYNTKKLLCDPLFRPTSKIRF